MNSDRLKKLSAGSKEFRHTKDILIDGNAPFMVQEALNMVKANVSVAVPAKEDGSAVKLFFTSALPATGKSTVTANLAAAMAKDVKVLLIDADMRKGRTRKFFHIPRRDGLSEILSGQAKAQDCLVPVDVDKIGEDNCLAENLESANLHVVASGKFSPNPYGLLVSGAMKKFLKEMEHNYAYIFIDTPPVEMVSDAIALVPETDGCVVVLKHLYSTKQETHKMLSTLKFANCKVIGAILNEYTGKYGEYGYSYKYSYKYGYKYNYSYNYSYGNPTADNKEKK